MKKDLVLLISMAFVFFTGCAQKVTIQALAPAEVTRLADSKVISVSAFENDTVALAQKIETAIAQKKIDGKSYFTVVDRANLAKVIEEQKIQSSGIMDEDSAVKVGRLLGAQAIISGSITSNYQNQAAYKEKRKACKDNTNQDTCKKTKYEYTVDCTKRNIGLSANVNITDTAKGDLIFSDKFTREKSFSKCSDNVNILPEKESIVKALANEFATAFAAKLTPHYVYFTVELMEKIEFEASSSQAKRLEGALKFIEHRRYDKAAEILDQLSEELQGKSYVLLYDLGVVSEALGRLQEARDYFTMAEELSAEPNVLISSSISRVDVAMKNRDIALTQINK